MSKYYLGLDVGGTKTHCIVADDEGSILGFAADGCGSYEYDGVDAARIVNERVVRAAMDSAGLSLTALSGVGMGVAGADLPPDFEMLERKIYTPLFGNIPRVFRNDSFAGLRGGTKAPFGIAVACGTDCTVAGRNRAGKETRVGGFGPEFGNKCSGTLIGEEGLKEVWRARDGIIPPTKMTELFVARSGCRDVDDLFHSVYSQRLTRNDLTPMAALVFRAAVDGDAAARAILEGGGRYLAAMANAAARALDMTRDAFDLVTAGSVFRGEGRTLIDAMDADVSAVCPNAKLVMPLFEPVVGALLMALDEAGTVNDELYGCLETELETVEKEYKVSLKAGQSL
ncbi:MAG: BadF/BadG/BcrA/BcrD ATPase family protein [Candidatus Hydrogenedentota bacterium]